MEDFNQKPETDFQPDDRGINFISYQDSSAMIDNSVDSFDDGRVSPIFNQIVLWILNISALLIPLFFLPWTSDFLEFQKQTLLVGLAGAGLIVWLTGVIKSGNIQLINTRLNLPVAMFLIAVFTASLFSLETFRSFFGSGGAVAGSFASTISYIIFFFLIVFAVNDGGRQILKFLIFSFTVALLFGILQTFGFFSIPFSFLKSRAFTTIGSLNAMGVFSAVMLPVLINYFGINKGEAVWKYVRIFAIGLSIFTLVLINWWILWAITIIGMTAFVAIHSFTEGFKPHKFVLPMVLIVIGVFLTLINLNLGFLRKGLPIEVSPSFSLSFNTLKETIKEKPVFGYGPENFIFAFDKFGSKNIAGTSFSDLRFLDSSSEFITFASQTGFAGIAALGYLLFTLVLIIARSARQERNIGGSALAFVIGLFTAFFLYPFNLVLYFVFWVGLAILILNIEGESKKKKIVLENSPLYSLASSVAFIVGLILVLAGFYYAIIRYVADIKFAKAATAVDDERALNQIVGAINLNSHESRYYRLGSNIIINQIAQEIRKKDDDPQRQAKIQNLVQAVFDVTKRATDKNPHDSVNWSQRGLIYQNLTGVVGGVEDLAIQYYNEALKRNPDNAVTYGRIGQIYLLRSELNNAIAANQKNAAEKPKLISMAKDDLAAAEKNFKRATEINRNFGVALYNLGTVYERQGKIKEAIVQLEKIMPFNANNAGLAFELGLLYYRDNKKDFSLQQMQRAVTIAPNYSNALWYLALIYEERNELPKAIENIEKILVQEQNKDNELVKQKLADLKAGKRSIPPEKVIDQKPLETGAGN